LIDRYPDSKEAFKAKEQLAENQLLWFKVNDINFQTFSNFSFIPLHQKGKIPLSPCGRLNEVKPIGLNGVKSIGSSEAKCIAGLGVKVFFKNLKLEKPNYFGRSP
jgi:hypothetical protein